MRFLEFFAANIRTTRTRGGPTIGPRRNSWLGARASACRRSPPSSRCMSRPGSRPGRASSRRRSSSNGSPRFSSSVRLAGDRPGRAGQPGASVRGSRHVVTSGQTPVLDPLKARALLDSIDISTHAGLRDRAHDRAHGLIPSPGSARRSAWRSRMSLCRIAGYGCGCARGRQRPRDACHQQPRGIPHRLFDGAVLRDDPQGAAVFRTIGRGTGKLTRTVLPQGETPMQ